MSAKSEDVARKLRKTTSAFNHINYIFGKEACKKIMLFIAKEIRGIENPEKIREDILLLKLALGVNESTEIMKDTK